MDICEKKACTGCFACINICPKKCIKMMQDEIGHIYPVVETSKCINCGMCKKTCPNNSVANKKSVKRVYATWSLDDDERKTSTSGGLCNYFSREIIKTGGVVYGCSSKFIHGEIIHIRCTRSDELEDLKGSKYIQSHINDAFLRCKKDLNSEKTVLFIGTPCQIAGLKSYLGKDYLNLITIDLICHGVPPQKLLLEHLEKQKIINPEQVSFRDGLIYNLRASANGSIYKKSLYKDLFYTGFGKNLFFRDSCYICKYSSEERVGDITLGDFWGLGKDRPFFHDTTKGVSVCMINTDKAQSFFASVKGGLFYEERTVKEAVLGNGNLRRPTPCHKNRLEFKKLYVKKGFYKSAKKCLRNNIIKYRILGFIKEHKCLAKLLKV